MGIGQKNGQKTVRKRSERYQKKNSRETSSVDIRARFDWRSALGSFYYYYNIIILQSTIIISQELFVVFF